MKTAAFFSVLLAAGALSATAFIGCSSDPEPSTTPTETDAGEDSTPDTAKPDTQPPKETGPLTCDQPLPTDFACKAPTKVAGATSCTDAQLAEFAENCLTANFQANPKCAAWKAANAECKTCIEAWALPPEVISTRVLPDRDKCYYAVSTDECSTAINCYFDCVDNVCAECSIEPGSGEDLESTEQQDCAERAAAKGGTVVPKGACYDVAYAKAKECFADPKLQPCIVSELFRPTGAGGNADLAVLKEQVQVFYRGACRDNGDWTNAYDPPFVTDAGVDASDDAADTSVEDTSVEDSAAGEDSATEEDTSTTEDSATEEDTSTTEDSATEEDTSTTEDSATGEDTSTTEDSATSEDSGTEDTGDVPSK